jgi:hypothetical protein
MAGKDFSTGKEKRETLWWTNPQTQELISILRAVRSSGDLLTAADVSVSEGRLTLHEDTLVALGSHLESLATKGLVICGFEGPEGDAPQAAIEGGAE